MSPRNQWRAVMSIAAVVLAASCAQTIGVAPCGDDQKDCGKQPRNEGTERAPSPPILEGRYETVETQPLTDLEPTWIKALPTPGGGYASDGRSSPILQADDDGNLVYFYMQRNTRTLYLMPIDDDGNALEKFEVPKPTEWNTYPSPEVSVPCEGQICINERGPSVKVTWIANCGKDGLETCNKREKLLYEDDFRKPATRRDSSSEAAQDITRDRKSNLYVVTSGEEPGVTKLDTESGDTVWERSDLGQNAFGGQDYALGLTGVPLDDGRFAVAAQAQALAFVGTPVTIEFIDADGTVTPGGMTFLAARSFLLNAGDRAAFVTSLMGDLIVTQISDGEHYRALQFLRDDYTYLEPEAAAVDPSGNVYVGTHSGSRTDSKPTLCKVTVEGKGSCYALPRNISTEPEDLLVFEQMVARDGGEVFVRSGTSLVRVVYPE